MRQEYAKINSNLQSINIQLKPIISQKLRLEQDEKRNEIKEIYGIAKIADDLKEQTDVDKQATSKKKAKFQKAQKTNQFNSLFNKSRRSVNHG